MIIDPKSFHAIIDTMVLERNCAYMDAVILYKEEANVEIETIASLVKQNPVLKAKVQGEAEELRLVRASPRLKF